jgi:CheY-like chemotaxis protein
MKILIIDDEPLVRKSLSRACASKGHQVIEASDGIEGLNKWISEKPDMVFLDVLMPGLSGPQLLKEIGSQRTGKVILMSAYSGEHNVQTAAQIGADLFIAKPFDDIFMVVAEAEKLGSK